MIKDIYRNIYNKRPEAYSEHSQDFINEPFTKKLTAKGTRRKLKSEVSVSGHVMSFNC